jgi:hypothetical protein
LKVQRRGRFEKVEVTADGRGLAAHTGSVLLARRPTRWDSRTPCPRRWPDP